MKYVLAFFMFIAFSVLLFFGTSYILSSYETKSTEEQVSYVEQQCSILANQIQLNGIGGYSMTSTSGARGTNVGELEQLANDIDGRVLIIDNHYKILSDTYNQNSGQYYVTSDLIRAFSGESIEERRINDEYMQIITGVNNQESGDIDAVLLVLTSSYRRNSVLNYLRTQRGVMLGLFLLISFILAALLVVFLRRWFGGVQKELDVIAAGHQDEMMKERGFREFYQMSVSFNEIINRYKELEDSRQQFVSNVSHELKTPITSMKILADSLLTQENVPAELYEEFLNDIVHELDREDQIINDLLTLVRMDKTQADLNLSMVDINGLLEMLLKRISPIADKRNITIRLETIRQVNAEVDEVKLSLACNNIIENAVKYNVDGGKVDVSLNGDHKFFYIRVKDTGIGIPEESREQIFERFYRVNKDRSRDSGGAGGTGLGLAIARNVILMHKGSIRVQSREEGGTTFTIRIPLNYVG